MLADLFEEHYSPAQALALLPHKVREGIETDKELVDDLGLYMICYRDGDREELSPDEVKLLLRPQELRPPA